MSLKVDPYSFQREAIAFHKAHPYSINGYTMGLGKTLIGIGATQGKRTLVVCPAFLRPNWNSEIEKFSPTPENYEVCSYHKLPQRKFDAIIFDEAHYLKNLKSQRTKRAHAYVDRYSPDTCLALTGTPIKNSVPEIYSLLKLCYRGKQYPEFEPYARSYYRFCNKFANRVQTQFGVKYEGLRNVEALKALIKPVYIRKRAEEVLDLPDEVDRHVRFAQCDEWDDELEGAWSAYEGSEDRHSFTAAKAVSALSKVGHTIDFVKEHEKEMERVVIFTDHVQSAERIAKAFGGAPCVTGKMPAGDRDKHVRAINAGGHSVLVATIGSLSVGVNLTGVNHMVFNDLPWVPADISQARKRIHRIGQKKTCFYYYMHASSVDERIGKALNKKRKILEAIEV